MHLERNGNTIATVDKWFQHARPMGGELQWRDGRSAKELAKAWCRETGGPEPPAELLRLLSNTPALAHLEFRVGYPEHRVRFDAIRGEPRNTDLAVLCDGPVGTVAISIEAKADETFGRTVGEEIVNAAAQWAFEERIGKLDRLRGLVMAILPRHQIGEAVVGQLRYQLLTAIAGAWAFASQHDASVAVLVVHEFLTPKLDARRVNENRLDLAKLVTRLTFGQHAALAAGTLVGPMPVPEAPSWLGVTKWYLGKCQTTLVDHNA
jgi:hypothetical protein